jgi:hypothetical protein
LAIDVSARIGDSARRTASTPASPTSASGIHAASPSAHEILAADDERDAARPAAGGGHLPRGCGRDDRVPRGHGRPRRRSFVSRGELVHEVSELEDAEQAARAVAIERTEAQLVDPDVDRYVAAQGHELAARPRVAGVLGDRVPHAAGAPALECLELPLHVAQGASQRPARAAGDTARVLEVGGTEETADTVERLRTFGVDLDGQELTDRGAARGGGPGEVRRRLGRQRLARARPIDRGQELVPRLERGAEPLGAIDRAVEIAVGRHDGERGLLSDSRDAGDVVDRVAHEREHVPDAFG